MQLRSGEVLGDGDGEDDEAFEEVNACDSRTSYILPRAARSVKGSFMFIVNQPAQEKLSQVGRSFICVRESNPSLVFFYYVVPGSEGNNLQRARPQLLWRTTGRPRRTPHCVSPTVHGPQVGRAGSGEGRGGRRHVHLPLLLLLLCGEGPALAMTQAVISFFSCYNSIGNNELRSSCLYNYSSSYHWEGVVKLIFLISTS